VIGIDHSAESVALAHSRVPREDLDRVELTSGDVRKMPFDDAIVDRVMCCEVIQHIPTAELRLQAIREFRRVLRPGGLAVISVYRWLGHVKRHRDGFWGEDLYRHAFTARELRRLIADAGFENVSVGGIGILPGLSERVGISPKRQARLAFTPLGRHLAHYLVARAWKPEP
jgi:SAM-dependent methyltransferase